MQLQMLCLRLHRHRQTRYVLLYACFFKVIRLLALLGMPQMVPKKESGRNK